MGKRSSIAIEITALVVVLLAALTGCGQEGAQPWAAPPPYDVYAKPDQSSDVVQDIRESVAEWNAHLRPYLGYDVFIYHAEGEPDPQACGTIVVGFGGFVHPGAQATADMRDRCHMSVNLNPDGFWNTTIVHELGHTLGLGDIAFDPKAEVTQSIMMQGTLDREILPSDVAAALREILSRSGPRGDEQTEACCHA